MTLWVMAVALAVAAPVSPDDIVRAALENDPRVARAAGDVEAARGNRSASTFLRENPQAELRIAPERIEAEVTQGISITGEGISDARSAKADLRAAEAVLTRVRLEAAADARRLYVRVVVGDAAARLAEQNLTISTNLRAAAERRLAEGDVSELDVHVARLDEASAVASWLSAHADQIAGRAELVAVTGLAADSEVAADPLDAAPTAGAASTTRSDVIAAEARFEAAEAALRRERAAIFPLLDVGVFYEDDGARVVGPMVALEVPLWNWNERGRGAARGDVMAAEADAHAMDARADAETAGAAEQLDAANRAAQLLGGDVSASADAALAAIQNAYEAGELDVTQAGLLRARVLEGARGWYQARAAVVEARLRALLATEDQALIP